jgi:tryptophan 7-halogenase
MMGQRLQPRGCHHLGRLMSRDQMQTALTGLSTNIANAVARLATHQAFLDQYLGEAVVS